MKSILVPTDFSSCADKAFDLALTIAAKANLPITVLHVTESGDADENEDPKKAVAKSSLDKLEGLRQKTSEAVIIRTHTDNGNIVDAVLKGVKTFAADLIIMGTQGATGFKKLAVGSKTAAVISRAPVPVLSIPAGYQQQPFKEVLLAIKNEDEDLQNLSPLFELADLFGARVRLAIFTGEGSEAVDYVSDRRTITQIQRKLQDAYQKEGIEVEHLSGTNFEETLQAYIAEHNINLLCMITHKRGFLGSLFNRSATQQMSYHATLPLLTLHSKHA